LAFALPEAPWVGSPIEPVRSSTPVLLILAVLGSVLPGGAADPSGSALPNPEDRLAVARGSQLARTYCTTCHLFPEPDAVDRTTWFEQILPRMKYRLGFTTAELDRSPDVQTLRQHHRIPLEPVVTEAQWLDICSYYLANAPEKPLPQTAPLPIGLGVPGFESAILPIRSPQPAVTALRILPEGGALMADDFGKSLQWVGPDGRVAGGAALGASVGSLRPVGGAMLASGLGSFMPTDERGGSVFWLRPTNGWSATPPVLSGLPRTTDANEADLNGDGRPDLVVSCFGNNLGRLSWWESMADGSHREHELLPIPGTLRTEIGDFDGDGRLDIAALVAQETEALFLFKGDGRGGFTRSTVFQRPPYWGHSHFTVADFNRDGRPDFLVTNGDNGEFSSPAKRVHGVRLHASQPGGGWKEAFFLPLYGAYHSVVRDFDRDGDLDIATISFFPEYQKAPRGSFVFFRNEGADRFTASTFRESATGRWVSMDAGDFDRDGAEDILLGSYIKGPTPVPTALLDGWQKTGRPLMLLRNTTPAGGRPPVAPSKSP